MHQQRPRCVASAATRRRRRQKETMSSAWTKFCCKASPFTATTACCQRLVMNGVSVVESARGVLVAPHHKARHLAGGRAATAGGVACRPPLSCTPLTRRPLRPNNNDNTHGTKETRLGQKFRVDATLYVDLRAAGASDDLADTVSYADVYECVSVWCCCSCVLCISCACLCAHALASLQNSPAQTTTT